MTTSYRERGGPRWRSLAGDTIVLKGPVVDYRRSGPICLSAANAIYTWIMLTRFGVKAPELDYDSDLGGHPLVCPCGIVRFKVRELEEQRSRIERRGARLGAFCGALRSAASRRSRLSRSC